MRSSRGRQNSRYLVFDNAEERGRFVQLYRDLFIPYSINSDMPIKAKRDGNEAVLKQLLEGYCIDPVYSWRELAFEKYLLIINILPEDWNYIIEKQNMEKVRFMKGRYYWRLV